MVPLRLVDRKIFWVRHLMHPLLLTRRMSSVDKYEGRQSSRVRARGGGIGVPRGRWSTVLSWGRSALYSVAKRLNFRCWAASDDEAGWTKLWRAVSTAVVASAAQPSRNDRGDRAR